MAEWVCDGLSIVFVVGGPVVDLTTSERDGGVDLCWVVSCSCSGWGNFEFIRLQMAGWGGLAMGWVLGLLWVGHF